MRMEDRRLSKRWGFWPFTAGRSFTLSCGKPGTASSKLDSAMFTDSIISNFSSMNVKLAQETKHSLKPQIKI